MCTPETAIVRASRRIGRPAGGEAGLCTPQSAKVRLTRRIGRQDGGEHGVCWQSTGRVLARGRSRWPARWTTPGRLLDPLGRARAPGLRRRGGRAEGRLRTPGPAGHAPGPAGRIRGRSFTPARTGGAGWRRRIGGRVLRLGRERSPGVRRWLGDGPARASAQERGGALGPSMDSEAGMQDRDAAEGRLDAQGRRNTGSGVTWRVGASNVRPGLSKPCARWWWASEPRGVVVSTGSDRCERGRAELRRPEPALSTRVRA